MTHSLVESRRQLKEGKESGCCLLRDSFLHLVFKNLRECGFVLTTISDRSDIIAGQVHEFRDSVLHDVANVGGGRRSCTRRTQVGRFLQETGFKDVETATSRWELFLGAGDVLEDEVDHPCPLVDTRVDRLRHGLAHNATHVFQELFSAILCLASRFVGSLHVPDSQCEQLAGQGLVALCMLLHALDAITQNPETTKCMVTV